MVLERVRHRPLASPAQAALRGALALCLAASAPVAWAQVKPPSGIYTCIDEHGRRLTADRPIPECIGREQQILNSDGSLRAVVPPTLTPEEQAAHEAQQRAAREARAAQVDAVRRDRNLMQRYPNEAKHELAREAALDTVRLAIKASEQRLKDLTLARKPLKDEAEFYEGKPLPPKLKAALDANDAALDAQRAAATTQAAELGRINKLYDAELDRLRKLWAGAPAGSLGPLPGAANSKSGAAAGTKPPR